MGPTLTEKNNPGCMPTIIARGASLNNRAHSLLPSFSTWLPLVAERVSSRHEPTDVTETMMSLHGVLFVLYLLPSAMRMSTGGAISSGRLRSGLLSSSSGLVVVAAAADDGSWWRNWLTLLSFGCCSDETEKRKQKKTKQKKKRE